MFKWIEGRQGTGYYKLPLLIFLSFDSYILKYCEGSYIPAHKDYLHNYNHYRLNIELCKAKKGGVFSCKKQIFNWWRINLFRPDLYSHSVSPIEKGIRYILSFGLGIKKCYNVKKIGAIK